LSGAQFRVARAVSQSPCATIGGWERICGATR
jgi:hypothetical protein